MEHRRMAWSENRQKLWANFLVCKCTCAHYACMFVYTRLCWIWRPSLTRWAYHMYIAWKPSKLFDCDCPLNPPKSQGSDFQAVLVHKLPVAGICMYVPATSTILTHRNFSKRIWVWLIGSLCLVFRVQSTSPSGIFAYTGAFTCQIELLSIVLAYHTLDCRL